MEQIQFEEGTIDQESVDRETKLFLSKFGNGRRVPNGPPFGDFVKTSILTRYGVTADDDEEDEDDYHKQIPEFNCNVQHCNMTFTSMIDFELHYNGVHRYICTICKKSKPNSRLLDIHVQENHDTFFKVLSQKQPSYQCFVLACEEKFIDPYIRRKHLVSQHHYPKNFRYDDTISRKKNQQNIQVASTKSVSGKEDITNGAGDTHTGTEVMEIDGIENNSSRTPLPKKKIELDKNQKSKMFLSHGGNQVSLAEKQKIDLSTVPICTSNKSSLMFIPRQVQKSFAKTLTNNLSNTKKVLNSGCMMELAESLPE